jgi:1-phosphofructokinase
MIMNNKKILTVTLNPAIDRTIFVPGFKANAVNRVEEDYSHAGGKGVNVASLLADYGFSLCVSGFLGKDNSLIFEKLFDHKKIKDDFIRIEGVTRTGIKIVNELEKETTDINFPGAAPSLENVNELISVIKNICSEVEWIVFAGSIPKGVSSDIYNKIIKEVKQANVKVAMDTSGKPLEEALISCPDLIKPNIEELEEITGRKLLSIDEIKSVALELNSSGIETVIVSMGADGALFSELGITVLAKPGSVKLVSTVGAGDAMVAGTIAGKLQGKPLEECAKLGTAFSVSALSRLSSDLPDDNELSKLKEQVIITQV